MRRLHAAVVAGSVLLIASQTAPAHHSFMAEFDQKKPLTVTGVVSKVDWQNPHAYFYVDAKDESGRVVKWSFETATPAALTSRGWKRDSVKAGDQITVRGYLAKHGTHFAAARSVRMPNGETVFTGSMDDGGPGK